MPRPRRIRAAGISQHLIQRGTDRLKIFRSDTDRQAFLAMLREAAQRHDTEIHAYALMHTHVHLLGTPATPTGIEKTMQLVGTRYAQYFNRRYTRVGALFEGRYKLAVVYEEDYWITCSRYIELNPVRAGIVATPEEYQWSSYRAHALGAADPLVAPHQRYLELGIDPATRQRVWRMLCAAGLTAEELNRIRFAAFENRILGTTAADVAPVVSE